MTHQAALVAHVVNVRLALAPLELAVHSPTHTVLLVPKEHSTTLKRIPVRNARSAPMARRKPTLVVQRPIEFVSTNRWLVSPKQFLANLFTIFNSVRRSGGLICQSFTCRDDLLQRCFPFCSVLTQLPVSWFFIQDQWSYVWT